MKSCFRNVSECQQCSCIVLSDHCCRYWYLTEKYVSLLTWPQKYVQHTQRSLVVWSRHNTRGRTRDDTKRHYGVSLRSRLSFFPLSFFSLFLFSDFALVPVPIGQPCSSRFPVQLCPRVGIIYVCVYLRPVVSTNCIALLNARHPFTTDNHNKTRKRRVARRRRSHLTPSVWCTRCVYVSHRTTALIWDWCVKYRTFRSYAQYIVCSIIYFHS